MYPERLGRWERIGMGASALFLLSLFALPWYSLTDTPQRHEQAAWLCGAGELSCTGFQTFPVLRWLFIAGASAPFILSWIILRGHKLSWPPGEMTMTVGFAMFVFVGYNGLLDRPLSGGQAFGVGLSWGYWIAFLTVVAIGVAGFMRAHEGSTRERRAPGTV